MSKQTETSIRTNFFYEISELKRIIYIVTDFCLLRYSPKCCTIVIVRYKITVFCTLRHVLLEVTSLLSLFMIVLLSTLPCACRIM